ncbi:MAG TPA: transposase [Gemmataceae bacterium]|nr:transposase [Gemmataceae bacterium]
MRMGLRQAEQPQPLWVPISALPRSPGHTCYDKLNQLLPESDFDRPVEDRCQPHYAACVGRPSLPPGVSFRMLLVGHFEALDSQRAIAWRCADGLSLRAFLGVPLTEATADPSSLSVPVS